MFANIRKIYQTEKNIQSKICPLYQKSAYSAGVQA